MNKIISTEKAPKAVGPYSQAIVSGENLLFVSGQIPLDPVSGVMVGNEVKAQTVQVLENLQAVILAAGFELTSVVKCTCFLQSMNDFSTFNETYATYFSENPPSRECVEVAKLPKGALVEVSAICAK
jgi:2-iminobutanoate/2-iminopropanoate deaminase